jgi:hypothetical protein
MKTYAVDVDGVASLAFRAKDDAAADQWLKGGVGKWFAGLLPHRGKALTVRPATIPEQAAWRAQSVGMQCEHYEAEERYAAEDDGERHDPNPNSYMCTRWRGPHRGG